MSLIETREVSRIYQMGNTPVVALDHVSVGINQGEFVAIQGTSGSGKSTLLNLLGGLDRPTSGEVLFDSTALGPLTKKQMAHYRRHSVGMIFQNFNLIPTMTAFENVRLALAFGGLRGAERRKRGEELLARVGLADRMQHRPSELSGGEQQRVALARAVVNGPAIILADEPTGNLDTENSRIVLDMFRDLNEKFAQTIIMITHNPEAAGACSRTIQMRDGHIV